MYRKLYDETSIRNGCNATLRSGLEHTRFREQQQQHRTKKRSESSSLNETRAPATITSRKPQLNKRFFFSSIYSIWSAINIMGICILFLFVFTQTLANEKYSKALTAWDLNNSNLLKMLVQFSLFTIFPALFANRPEFSTRLYSFVNTFFHRFTAEVSIKNSPYPVIRSTFWNHAWNWHCF